MFNEQKRYESHIQRLQSEVHRSSSFLLHYLLDEPRIVSAECATRSASIRLIRMKNQDVRDQRVNLQRQFDSAEADNHRAVEERDSTILDLRSLLERRNRELNVLEQSVATTQDKRTRL